MWLHPQPLVLASKSAARRAMLEAAGLPLAIDAADIDERAVEQGLAAKGGEAIAEGLAVAKAVAVAARHRNEIVVAADQTLACDGRLYHKAVDRAAARDQLLSLRGRTHALHSGIAVAIAGEVTFADVATARLTMRDFSHDFLDGYLDRLGAAAFSSVGGYQIEGIGIHLFERIEGDHFTILGMPLLPLLAYFRRAGLAAQ